MLALLLFLFSSITCVITANLVREQEKITDIIHSNLPIVNMPYISDILILLQTILAISIMSSESLIELFFIMGITQLFRVFCFFSTTLPPLKKYSDKYRLGGINGNGTEYIFSGHASYSAITFIYLYTNNIISFFPLLVYNIISQSLISLTRNHYTVDIILAWIIVPLIYGNVTFCKGDLECSSYIKFFF
jgi:PAP2 superfamily C-terminal